MEDVFKFLLVAAVIATGLIRQFKKETNKNADKSPGIPMPDVDNPLPENWGGGTYGGFIPEGPQADKQTEDGIQTVRQIQIHFHKGLAPLPRIPSAGARRSNIRIRHPLGRGSEESHYLVRDTSTEILRQRIMEN